MKTSRRFSTTSDATPCLASRADVARPPAPAPTIRTGTCDGLIRFMPVTALLRILKSDSYYYIVVTITFVPASPPPRRLLAADRRPPNRSGCDDPRCHRRSAHPHG